MHIIRTICALFAKKNPVIMNGTSLYVSHTKVIKRESVIYTFIINQYTSHEIVVYFHNKEKKKNFFFFLRCKNKFAAEIFDRLSIRKVRMNESHTFVYYIDARHSKDFFATYLKYH